MLIPWYGCVQLTLYQITVAAGSSCCLHYDIMLELEIVYTAILNKNSLYFVQYFMINSEQITPIKVQIIKSSNKRNSFYFFKFSRQTILYGGGQNQNATKDGPISRKI